MDPITVMIAGEFRQRAFCRKLLDREAGIAVAGDIRPGLKMLAAAARLQPRVLLLDFTRLRLDALVGLSAIRRHSPRTRVILLTSPRTSDVLILEGLKRGALGCLDKAALPRLLPKAIRAVSAGEAWVPRRMARHLRDGLLPLAGEEPIGPAAGASAPKGRRSVGPSRRKPPAGEPPADRGKSPARAPGRFVSTDAPSRNGFRSA